MKTCVLMNDAKQIYFICVSNMNLKLSYVWRQYTAKSECNKKIALMLWVCVTEPTIITTEQTLSRRM